MSDQKNITEEGGVAPMGTISVSAPTLRRMLTAVLPHAAGDDSLPSLMAVKFEVRAGVLYLVTTDRYTLAVAREPIPAAASTPVPDAGFLLPLEAARALRRMLKGAGDVVALSVADGALRADCSGGTSGKWGSWPVDGKWQFVNWRPMLHAMLTGATRELGDGYGLDPRKMRRFTVGKPSWAGPVRVRIAPGSASEKAPPVMVVTCGDWFAGAQMTMRMVREDAPAGLAAWADVTAPEQKPEAA